MYQKRRYSTLVPSKHCTAMNASLARPGREIKYTLASDYTRLPSVATTKGSGGDYLCQALTCCR
jgi:hypothetical protein